MVEAEQAELAHLSGHRLLRVAGVAVMTQMMGTSPGDPDGPPVVLATDDNPEGIAPLEWSNALARVLHESKGQTVRCDFSQDESWYAQVPWSDDPKTHVSVMLKVGPSSRRRRRSSRGCWPQPGELTQGLCSPWQNDFRECSCYYWASARPDYVNVEPSPSGASRGDNWLQKERTGDYVPDDYVDSRLILYATCSRGGSTGCGSRWGAGRRGLGAARRRSRQGARLSALGPTVAGEAGLEALRAEARRYMEASAPRTPEAHVVTTAAGLTSLRGGWQPALRLPALACAVSSTAARADGEGGRLAG